MKLDLEINTVIQAIEEESEWEDHEAFKICPAVEKFMEKVGGNSEAMLEKMFRRGDHPEYPLAVWKEKRLLIDGHRRYRMCQKLEAEFRIHLMSFDSAEDVLEWMMDHQESGRNLSRQAIKDAETRRLIVEQKRAGYGDKTSEVDEACKRLGISKATFYRQRERVELMDGLIPSLTVMFSDGSVECPAQKLKKIAALSAEEQKDIHDSIIADHNFLKGWGNTKKNKSRRETVVNGDPPPREQPNVVVLPDHVKPEGKAPAFDEIQIPSPEHVSNERLKEYVKEITKTYGKFARAMDSMVNDFLPEGAAKVDWKKRVDRAHRQINKVIEEITEEFDG